MRWLHQPVRGWRTLWRRRCVCGEWPCAATLLPDRVPDGDQVPWPAWNSPTWLLATLRVPPYMNRRGWWSA